MTGISIAISVADCEGSLMLSHQLLREEGILIVSPEGPLTREDFTDIAKDVDPYIETKGALSGLVIQVESFPGWEDFGALVSHLRFIRNHHKKIKKVAAVTDDGFLSIMPRVVDHFVSAEVKYFQHDRRQAALDWIRES